MNKAIGVIGILFLTLWGHLAFFQFSEGVDLFNVAHEVEYSTEYRAVYFHLDEKIKSIGNTLLVKNIETQIQIFLDDTLIYSLRPDDRWQRSELITFDDYYLEDAKYLILIYQLKKEKLIEIPTQGTFFWSYSDSNNIHRLKQVLFERLFPFSFGLFFLLLPLIIFLSPYNWPVLAKLSFIFSGVLLLMQGLGVFVSGPYTYALALILLGVYHLHAVPSYKEGLWPTGLSYSIIGLGLTFVISHFFVSAQTLSLFFQIALIVACLFYLISLVVSVFIKKTQSFVSSLSALFFIVSLALLAPTIQHQFAEPFSLGWPYFLSMALLLGILNDLHVHMKQAKKDKEQVALNEELVHYHHLGMIGLELEKDLVPLLRSSEKSQNLTHLTLLMEDLIPFTRINPHKSYHKVKDLFEELLDGLPSDWIKNEFDGNFCLLGDKNDLCFALNVILKNALQALELYEINEADKQIRLYSTQTGELVIENTGPMIEFGTPQLLFRPFTTNRRSLEKGAHRGMGLSHARYLLLINGYDLLCHSTTEKTVFSIKTLNEPSSNA